MRDKTFNPGIRPRQVKLKQCDWDDRRTINLVLTHFASPLGAKPLTLICRTLSLYPHQWWTTGQVRRCLRQVIPSGVFGHAWMMGRKRDMIERAHNPDHDPTRSYANNPKWLYRITRVGLVYVEMFD